MKWCLHLCVWICLVFAGSVAAFAAGQQGELIVLTYHDIVAEVGKNGYSTSRSNFVAHMDYLETHGYQPVSLPFLTKVDNGEAQLPKKAVLLTFDDGLKSYADFVVPLLTIYNFPSVLSVVTGWVDGKNTPPEYHRKLLDWPAIRKLDQLPLVAIISHSNDLHHGVQANPQGNEAAAGVTRIFSTVTNKYETEEEFLSRIMLDLESSTERFHKELGRNPVGITWPYGRFDGVVVDLAHSLGMDYQLTLEEGPTRLTDLPVINRTMLRNEGVEDFVRMLTYQTLHDERQRFAEIRLDEFIGETAEDQNRLLSAMLNTLERLRVNTVIVHPFSANSGKAFFQTGDFDVATDVLGRVTHQLNTRLGIRHVYLGLPEKINFLVKQAMVTDLSRLVWFNGIVFNGQVTNEIGMIKQIVSHYHPRVRFGQFVPARNAKDKTSEAEDSDTDDDYSLYDFVIISVNTLEKKDKLRRQILSAKSLPVKTMIAVEANKSDVVSISKKFDTLDALDVKHYGVLFGRELYGASDVTAVSGN